MTFSIHTCLISSNICSLSLSDKRFLKSEGMPTSISTANHKFITVTSQTEFTTFERETFVLTAGNIDGIVLPRNNSCKARSLNVFGIFPTERTMAAKSTIT